MPKPIETRRLLVRPFATHDYEAWHALRAEALPKRELTRARFASWLRQKERLRERDLQYYFGIFDQRSGEALGSADLTILVRLRIQVANLGYHIHPSHRGQGYAQEAARAALTIAFKQLKLHRVEAGITPDNKASIAVAQAIGMRDEGVRRKYFHDGKQWIDLRIFVASAEDYGCKNRRPSIRTQIQDAKSLTFQI